MAEVLIASAIFWFLIGTEVCCVKILDINNERWSKEEIEEKGLKIIAIK